MISRGIIGFSRWTLLHSISLLYVACPHGSGSAGPIQTLLPLQALVEKMSLLTLPIFPLNLTDSLDWMHLAQVMAH
jgi:hypothetical protein